MTQINLLPWREKRRKIQKFYFGLLLGSAIFLALMILIGMHLHYKNLLRNQEHRNSYIQSELNKENHLLNNIESKMKEYAIIESQLKLAIELRKANYNVLKVLKELALIVPNTISIRKVQRDGAEIILSGAAATSVDLTQFMKNIEKSPVFDAPGLSQIISDKDSNNGNFEIKIQQTL